jgi:hypothetical protein
MRPMNSLPGSAGVPPACCNRDLAGETPALPGVHWQAPYFLQFEPRHLGGYEVLKEPLKCESSREKRSDYPVNQQSGRARHSVRAVGCQPTRSAGSGLPALPVSAQLFII